jgi:RNA polymerase sigma factor (sigma-70 family)
MADGEQTDGEWVARAREGSTAAYSMLVRRHQDRIYRFVLQMLGSRDEALEAAQDTFVRAWQALPAWRPEAQFHTWLFRIAANVALDALRRRKTVRFVPLEDYDAASEAPGPDVQLEGRQRLGALDAALAELSAEQREIVLLREVEGLSYGELAVVLAIDEGTVKSRLARSRAALAQAWKRIDE